MPRSNKKPKLRKTKIRETKPRETKPPLTFEDNPVTEGENPLGRMANYQMRMDQGGAQNVERLGYVRLRQLNDPRVLQQLALQRHEELKILGILPTDYDITAIDKMEAPLLRQLIIGQENILLEKTQSTSMSIEEVNKLLELNKHRLS